MEHKTQTPSKYGNQTQGGKHAPAQPSDGNRKSNQSNPNKTDQKNLSNDKEGRDKTRTPSQRNDVDE